MIRGGQGRSRVEVEETGRWLGYFLVLVALTFGAFLVAGVVLS